MLETSTKPYMIRAIHEWCTDNNYTPYITVCVSKKVLVPKDFVKNNEIILNISCKATQNLKMQNEMISFNAKFSGVTHKIEVPIKNVLTIYAQENGQGMTFSVDVSAIIANDAKIPTLVANFNTELPQPPQPPKSPRSPRSPADRWHLRVIK